MKKYIFVAIAIIFALSASAQEPKFELPELGKPSKPELDFILPDSLAHLAPWQASLKHTDHMTAKPIVPMTSVVVIQHKNMPARVTVINSNSLRYRKTTLSNGQSWNWSPYPDAHLDARTLSFPKRR